MNTENSMKISQKYLPILCPAPIEMLPIEHYRRSVILIPCLRSAVENVMCRGAWAMTLSVRGATTTIFSFLLNRPCRFTPVKVICLGTTRWTQDRWRRKHDTDVPIGAQTHISDCHTAIATPLEIAALVSLWSAEAFPPFMPSLWSGGLDQFVVCSV